MAGTGVVLSIMMVSPELPENPIKALLEFTVALYSARFYTAF
jgi:hypothetical protein